jgi:hypothetical protein
MDRSDASALADLKMHWDEAYVIGLDGDVWSARYHTSTDDLRAHTSSELRELIRSDYAYRQKVSPAIDDSTRDDTANLGDAPTGEDGEDSEDSEDSEDEEDERVNFAAIRGERMST